MDQYFKSEGQCQGQKISIFGNVENWNFQLTWTNFWLNIAEDDKKIDTMVIEDNASAINSKPKWIKN